MIKTGGTVPFFYLFGYIPAVWDKRGLNYYSRSHPLCSDSRGYLFN